MHLLAMEAEQQLKTEHLPVIIIMGEKASLFSLAGLDDAY
jgi:hypothetical protein